jgi:hypothetical protein|tara:strand:- start:1094 stop:1228 length:135 start_codon:yes stop_codon:yes gene_type:complete
MPIVNGKKYPYTQKGMEDAAKARKVKGYRGGGGVKGNCGLYGRK